MIIKFFAERERLLVTFRRLLHQPEQSVGLPGAVAKVKLLGFVMLDLGKVSQVLYRHFKVRSTFLLIVIRQRLPRQLFQAIGQINMSFGISFNAVLALFQKSRQLGKNLFIIVLTWMIFFG